MLGIDTMREGDGQIHKLRGLTPVISKLKRLVFGSVETRIANLSLKIESLFENVKEQFGDLAIPGLFDPNVIPKYTYQEFMAAEQEHFKDVFHASQISENCGFAWIRPKTDTETYLEYFIREGKVISPKDHELQMLQFLSPEYC